MSSEYIYRIQPTRPAMLTAGPTKAEAGSLAGHVVYLQKLAAEEVVLLAGRTQTTEPTTFGIVILRADSQQAAADIVAADPAVRDGVMRAELFPYRIAVLADSIAELVEEDVIVNHQY